jgi:tetratricopeptide (TPR) repeat protein
MIPNETEDSAIEALLARAEEAGDVEQQLALLERAAALYETSGDCEAAFWVKQTAYRVRPGAREDLERLAACSGRFAELEQLLSETTPALPLDLRAAAWCDLGKLRLHRLRQTERALEALEISLAVGFTAEAAHLRVESLTQLGRYAELARALEELAGSALTTEDRCAFLARLADVRERHLGDARGAEDACRRWLALDPRAAAARNQLERLARARGDLDAALVLVDDKRAIEPDDLTALADSAQLCEKLGRRADAAERWEELRGRQPADRDALRALDRLYAELGRLRDRAAVLEAMTCVVESERERVALHRNLADVWTELGDRPRAISSLEWLIVGDANDVALRALEPLYRAEGRFRALADAWTRQARAAEPARRAQLLRDLAGLFERELEDAGQAIACWEQLLESAPQDEEGLDALARLYESVEAWDRAMDARERWAALTGSADRRVRAAELCASAGDLPRAQRLLEKALADQPRSTPIRLALAASFTEQPARALELIDAAPAPVHPALLALAARLREPHEPEKALANLRAVLERAPDHLEARRRACALALQLGHHAQVIELASALPEDGAHEIRLERWLALARAAQIGGDRALAAQATARAMELAPDEFAVRQLQVERLLDEDKLDEAQALLPELHRAASTPSERALASLLEGQEAHSRGDSDEALAAYRRALAAEPACRPALRRVLDLVVELERWEEALSTLAGLVELEMDARLRARFRHLMGHVCEEELGRLDEALVHYRAALADDPDHPRCAERIELLLRERRDFPALAELCKHMLERTDDVSKKAQLWRTLADAAEGAGDHEAAIAALEVVLRLDADDQDSRRRLAARYVESGPDRLDRAIEEHQALLKRDHLHVPSYRALATLYPRVGAHERGAACERAARLLSAHESRKTGTRGGQAPALLATQQMGAEEWRLLRHPDEDRFLGVVSALLAPVLASAAAPRIEKGQLGVPVARNDAVPFAQAVAYVTRILDVPAPDLYTRNDQKAPVQFVVGSTIGPAFVIGLPLLGDRRKMDELVAPLALEAALLRPERALRLLIGDPNALALMLRAVIAVAHDETPAPGEAVTAAALRRWLQPLALDQLNVVGRRLREEGGELIHRANGWLRAADLSAARAALAITGDLERTLAALEECAANPRVARAARHELVWASVTDELWTVRRRLQVAPASERKAKARRA